jgi:hypothetical protein
VFEILREDLLLESLGVPNSEMSSIVYPRYNVVGCIIGYKLKGLSTIR